MLSADAPLPSTRPYLIRALHEWCTEHGFTPFLAVKVDAAVQVPVAYVSDGEIVLNVGCEATSGLRLGNDFIEFEARFGGVARGIVIPVDHVIAIYARENGQGMAFPAPPVLAAAGVTESPSAIDASPSTPPVGHVSGVNSGETNGDGGPPGPPPGSNRAHLRRVK